MGRTNYVFVDFENVHEADWDRVAGKPVHVTLVLGEQNRYFPIPMVKQMLKCAAQIALIESKKTGKNAADFILAKLIGERNASDPHGYFHIVSKDKGFDALIDHLKGEKILAARRISFSDIPVLMNLEERIAHFESFLKQKATGLPGKLTTLQSQIQVIFGKALTVDEVDAIVSGLKKRGVLATGGDGKVSYL